MPADTVYGFNGLASILTSGNRQQTLTYGLMTCAKRGNQRHSVINITLNTSCVDGKIKAQRYPTEHFTSPRVKLHLPGPGHTWLNHAPCRSRFDWALASTLACSQTATTAQGGALPPCSTSDGHCKPTPPPAVNVNNRQILLPNDRFPLFALV
jgi:hypothetical protein